MEKKVAPYSTKLHKDTAWWMAKISKLVYTKISVDNQMPDEDEILEELKKIDSDFESVSGFDKNSAQAVIIEHKDFICWAFRGTNELVDWIDNLNAFSIKQLFGEFHKGFWNSVEDIWSGLWEKQNELQNQNKRPLFITGHSLGGAMATIAAARLINEDIPFSAVYTFGQPRAMTRDTSLIFNSECKSRYFRFHNNDDIVTRVPARVMGFSHIGSYLYITNEMEIHREVGFWFRFIDNIPLNLSDLKANFIDGIKDHNMDNYILAVEKWDLKK